MNATLLHIYATFAVGGAQARFAAIANHFGRRWRHVIVTLDGNTACREWLDPGLDVSFLPADVRNGDTLGNVRRFRAVLGAVKPKTANCGSIEWAMANTVAALRAEKNIARLVRAFALAADCPGRLMIVGDGAERAALEALVREARMFQADAELFDGAAGLPVALMDIDRPPGLSAPCP